MRSSAVAVFGLVFWMASQAHSQWDPYAGPPQYSPGPSVQAPASTTASRRIHILIVADSSDEEVGKGLAVDLETIEATFRQLVPNPEQVNFKVLKGDAVTKEAILQALADFRPGYADTIALFFSGHGSHNGHGHFLAFKRGDLYRSDIIAAMRETKARPSVLVTNGCNLLCEKEVEHVRVPPATSGPIRPPIAERVSPIIEELFLKPYGVVDINGASEGQVCWAEPPRGTTTMRPFCDCLLENRDKRLAWNAFVAEFGKKVQQELELRKYRDATSGSNSSAKACQTPRIWSLPQEDRGPRLGVEKPRPCPTLHLTCTSRHLSKGRPHSRALRLDRFPAGAGQQGAERLRRQPGANPAEYRETECDQQQRPQAELERRLRGRR